MNQPRSLRILMICRYFAPDNTIGAVRTTKIAKLFKTNHAVDVIVVTAENGDTRIDPLLAEDLTRIGDVFHVDYGLISKKLYYDNNKIKLTPSNNIHVRNANRSSSRMAKLRLRSLFRTLRSLIEDIELLFAGKRVLREVSTSQKFDVVYSTYNTIFCHWLASHAVKKGYADYWIADFRDPISFHPTSKILKKYADYLFNKIVARSDLCTVVSMGIPSTHKLNTHLDKITLLPNAYDLNDIKNVASDSRSAKFRLTYTGSLYGGRRDFRALFDAISQLNSQKLIDFEKMEILYAGGEGRLLKQMAADYGVDSMVKDLGNLPRDESLRIQMSSHMLLLASWNERGSEGILPGKYFEYLMMSKPIVCFVCGKLPQSQLASLIRQNNLGYCFEQANHEVDMGLLQNYLHRQYQLFMDGMSLDYSPNQTYIKSCSYDVRAQELFELVCKLMR